MFNTNTMWGIEALAALSIMIGATVVALHRKTGWWAYVVGNFAWMAWSVHNEAWMFLAQCIYLQAITFMGLYKWTKDGM